MNTLMAFLFLLLQSGFSPARLEQPHPFDHPFNTVGNSWVIADFEISDDGKVDSIQRVQGTNPFNDIALSSLQRWRFVPARTNTDDIRSRVTAVFLFRPPELFASKPIDVSNETSRDANTPPSPVTLVDPGYPIMSVGAGATVVEIQISSSGLVEGVRTVTDEPGLAESTKRAVQSWKFAPALRNGIPSPGTVIVVVSYMRPVLAQPSFLR